MTPDQLTRTFAALADPTRREIVDRLSRGEATVTELAEPLSISMPAVSRHLKVLENAGLIARGREAQWRPSRLQADPLGEAIDWMGSRKREWEQRIARLDRHLQKRGRHDGRRRTS
jgi:DNA-binding transcriptional ArsR family regulator